MIAPAIFSYNIADKTQYTTKVRNFYIINEQATHEAMKYLLLLLIATLSFVLAKKPKVTEKAILEIQIEGEQVGKIVIGLFGKSAPKAVKNFVGLCQRPIGSGYKGSHFNKIVKGEYVEGGYFIDNGESGSSIYGGAFREGKIKLKFYGAGWIGMVNSRQNEINIHFFISLKELYRYKREHVVFGKVLKGMDVVKKIGDYKTQPGGRILDSTSHDIVVADCTVEVVKKPFTVEKTDATE